jgi:hypothetical protein
MKVRSMLFFVALLVSQQGLAVEVTVETAKQAAELAGVKVPDSVNTAATLLGGSQNAPSIGSSNTGDLLGAAALVGNGNSGNLGTAAGLLTGTTSPIDAAAIAVGVKKEPTAEEKAADALKSLMK